MATDMEGTRILLILLMVICACSIVGTWSGLKAQVKGLIKVLRRD